MIRILLPTDFSENAFNAIRYAVKLYAEEDCHFILLHTLYNADYIMYSSLGGIYKEKSNEGLEKTKERIDHEFNNDRHTFELVSSYEMLHQEIKDRVKDRSIDMIIMGTNGATGSDQILFGTTTVHAIKVAKCPLLTIPSDYQFKKPKNIVFATKYEIDFSEYQMNLLKEIAVRTKANIHAMRANYGSDLKERQKNAKNELTRFFEGLPLQHHDIAADSVPQALEKLAQKTPIDVLVMIKHKRSFIEKLLFTSVIHEIGFNSSSPFLVLPAEKYEPDNE
ncbi:Nucleotide-binding universal stress protein, UspA family [Salegentibacter echinorum]|uniref:Nucleotide-binding universal stress protein, UspA family n=1 Tax=Salegentibacter echinorum TaxID=1073325 RepID=A0A1M5JBH0_SALEC|nr:universal stress protein [Salegentibacter echinorum]SHG37639.1 Nucleotide-binding universal stress protein, UspA family [Salegentibacter echinorum]